MISASLGVLDPTDSPLQRPSRSNGQRDLLPWLLASICGLALLVAFWLTRSINPLNPDTPSYLQFDPSRTIGYPAFLWIVKAVTGEAILAVPVQMILLAGSLFLLGLSFHRAVNNSRLSLLFQLLLVGSPDLWGASAMLLTEALATACVALWCAQLLKLLTRPSLRGLILLALIAAAGLVIRPSLLVLFAGTGIAAFLLESTQERWKALISVATIAIAAWAATPAAYLMIHGSPATGSPFARGLLQHTLFCDEAAASADPDSAFVEEDSEIARSYIHRAPEDVQIGLEHLYSAPLRFGSIIPALARRHHIEQAWQTDPLILQIAEQRIAGNPLCYVESVLRTYFKLATQDRIHSGSTADKVREFIAQHPPAQVRSEPLLESDAVALRKAAAELHVGVPRLNVVVTPQFKDTKSPLMWVGRMLFGGAAVLGLIALLALFGRPTMSWGARRLTLCLAALGASFHGLFALTAVVELAIVRYTVPAWPIACTLLGLAGMIAVQATRRVRIPGYEQAPMLN